jgi:hypothetical protein
VFDFNNPSPPGAPRVIGLRLGAGAGKTRLWRQRIAAPLAADPTRSAVLAVPRHRLGDEIVIALAEQQGVRARVYRGREADDPDSRGCQMCREYERATEIEGALGNVGRQACRNGTAECESHRVCGYQAQRLAKPQVWIVPHQLLFRQRPDFIPQPDSLAIDESFWNASLHGVDRPYPVLLSELEEIREIDHATKFGSRIDAAATADLAAVSTRVARVLREEIGGRVRPAAMAGISKADLHHALQLEWRRKVEPDVTPGMPLPLVAERCQRVAQQNQLTAKLTRFWELLIRTISSSHERSPWIDLKKAVPLPTGKTEAAVFLVWSDDVHHSWTAGSDPIFVMGNVVGSNHSALFPADGRADQGRGPSAALPRQADNRPLDVGQHVYRQRLYKRGETENPTKQYSIGKLVH